MKHYPFFVASASVLCAQTATQTPLAVHRQAAPPMPSLTEIQEAAKILTQGSANPQQPATTIPTVSAPQAFPNTQDGPPLTELPTKAPKGYKVRTEVPLDPGTAQALDLATKFLERPNVPHEGKDGRLIYTYGAGLPTVVCAPLRWCLIELQPGEVAKNAVPSDERWDAKPLVDTSGDVPQSIIAMRPRYAGLDSSLVIMTNKHSYFLRLVSHPTRYMSRVTFDYPEEEKAIAWTAYHQQTSLLAKPEANTAPEKPKADDAIQPYTLSAEKGFWGKEKRPYFWPVAAYEKGGLVYITLPKEVADRRAPSLQRVGPSGKLEPLNYSSEGNTYVAHTLFEKAVLILGTGKHAEKVYITRPEAKK